MAKVESGAAEVVPVAKGGEGKVVEASAAGQPPAVARVWEKPFPEKMVTAAPVQTADAYYKNPLTVSKYNVHSWNLSRTRRGLRRMAMAGLVVGAAASYVAYRIASSDEGEYVARPTATYLLRTLPLRKISRFWGQMCEQPCPNWVVASYAKLTGCNLDEAKKGVSEYGSLQELFTRELKPGTRPISSAALVAPCDGTVLRTGTIDASDNAGPQWITQVKGWQYELTDLLRYKPGPVGEGKKRVYAVLYLAPGDYHRFHIPVEGWRISTLTHIFGNLLSVHPWAYKTIDELFCYNERLSLCGSWVHGAMCYCAVAAMNVGNIRLNFDAAISTNNADEDATARDSIVSRTHCATRYTTPLNPGPKGAELGKFLMGSTVVVIADVPEAWDWSVDKGSHCKVGQGLMHAAAATAAGS